ncbi:hypothetical protein V8C86DRAFT_3103587 [Haematococcus lacustris]
MLCTTVHHCAALLVTVVANPAGRPELPCFNTVQAFIYKLSFRSQRKCQGSVKEVWVNGERKTSNVYWDNIAGQEDSVLRLTALFLTSATAMGSTISLAM